MEKAKPKKSHKIAIPTIIVIAILGALLGGATGISILFGLGALGLILALAAASFAGRKEKQSPRDGSSNQLGRGADRRTGEQA